MNCLVCFKPFVKEKEFENYDRDPELCTNTISKLFGISNDPDVQGVFEDLEVCRGCHELLEKVGEMVTWFEGLQGRVNQARILIKQMLDTSKEASQPSIVNSRSLDMSKSNLDRLVLLKAIEARNPPPPSPSSAMDLQEEDDNGNIEEMGKWMEIPTNSKLTTVFQIREEIDSEIFIDESYFSNNSANSSESTMSIEAEKTLVISLDNSKPHKNATKKRKSFKSSSSEKSITRSKPKKKQNKNRSEASTILLGDNGSDEKFTREFISCQFINLKNGSFQCIKCFKILGKRSRRGHLLIHGPRKFQCTHCKKLFARNSRLISHIKGVHEKRKDFKCSIKECGKRFSRNDHLITHVRTVHEGKRDFKCLVEDCDKSFTSKGHLNRHIDKVHKKSNKIQVLSISSPEDLEPISAQQMEIESIEDQMAPNYDGMWHIENAMEGQEAEEIQEDFDPYEYL